MKQLLILSGKGGTGKTTISSAFIKLSQAQAYADCDVDAPNLHLLMAEAEAEVQARPYYGMPQAEIDRKRCKLCSWCQMNCRFGAITYDRLKKMYKVDPFSCEGCSLCSVICKAGAISMKETVSGELKLYKTAKQVFSTAQLKMGRGNSGKLVTEVKKGMRQHAPSGSELAIIDGSPGLGCPVIASLSGVDLVLIVAEPSLSGLSDLERVVKTAGMFQADLAVCINKSDVNLDLTQAIKSFCEKNNLPFMGEVPFDPEAVKAVNNSLTVVDSDCRAGTAVRKVFTQVKNLLSTGSDSHFIKMYQENLL